MLRSMPSHQSRPCALLVAAVLFGLLAVPVECTVAMGPHSMFLDPHGVAALQGAQGIARQSHASHAGHEPGGAVASGPMRAQHTAAHQPTVVTSSGPPQSRLATALGGSTPDAAPPRPAGFASDAIVRVAIPGAEHAPPLVGSLVRAPNGDLTSPKVLLLGPEPPPPRS